MVNFYLSKYY